jgi:hypothetical protein
MFGDAPESLRSTCSFAAGVSAAGAAAIDRHKEKTTSASGAACGLDGMASLLVIADAGGARLLPTLSDGPPGCKGSPRPLPRQRGSSPTTDPTANPATPRRFCLILPGRAVRRCLSVPGQSGPVGPAVAGDCPQIGVPALHWRRGPGREKDAQPVEKKGFASIHGKSADARGRRC